VESVRPASRRAHGVSGRPARPRGGASAGRDSGEDILLVALVGLELLEPLLGVGLAGTGLVAVQLHEGVAHRGRHTAAVAADIDDGPLLQGLPHRVGGGPDGVLHVPVANGVCHCPRFSAPAF
jgi:hypothetical protein